MLSFQMSPPVMPWIPADMILSTMPRPNRCVKYSPTDMSRFPLKISRA